MQEHDMHVEIGPGEVVGIALFRIHGRLSRIVEETRTHLRIPQNNGRQLERGTSNVSPSESC